MTVLTAQRIVRQFDREPVLRDVSFELRAGEKVGLVGPNGCGKSTLMKILAGDDQPDQGTVATPATVEVKLLKQQIEDASEEPLIDVLKGGLAHLYALQEEHIKLGEQMATASPAELDKIHARYDHVQHELERHDAFAIDHRVEEVLQGLGFTRSEWDRPLNSFSGGQQNRAGLGAMLLGAPDVMLLDEPTNHLDIETVRWLEDFLQRAGQAVLVVSHDRYFLDKVTNRTLELLAGKLTDWPGNFSKYWSLREERVTLMEKHHAKQQADIEKKKDFIRRNMAGQKTKQAQSRQKELDKMELVDLPPDFVEYPMGFRGINGETAERTGDIVVDADGVSKGYSDNTLFEDVTLRIERGNRIGIFGPNGVGKTTLLRALLGEIEPDAGRVKLGTNVKVGYHDQKLESVDPRSDAVEAVRPHGDVSNPGKLRGLLARFGITGDMAKLKVAGMSGGERTKVALARLAAMNCNVLVLDEPTNHLDFWACAALERSIREFGGTVLIVSHDRYFLDHCCSHVISLSQERWRYYDGTYSEYMDSLDREAARVESEKKATKKNGEKKTDKAKPKDKPKQKPKRTRKFPFRTTEAIEADIVKMEEKIGGYQMEMADPGVLRDGDRVRSLQQDLAYAEDELAQLMEHWEEASELN